MASAIKPPTPSIPMPKSDRPTPPKSGKPPAEPSPYANAPLKAPFPANPFKSVSQVGGLPGGLPDSFGKQPTGPLTRAAVKAVPLPKPIEQQAADFQKQRMADVKRVESAIKADKRAAAINSRRLS